MKACLAPTRGVDTRETTHSKEISRAKCFKKQLGDLFQGKSRLLGLCWSETNGKSLIYTHGIRGRKGPGFVTSRNFGCTNASLAKNSILPQSLMSLQRLLGRYAVRLRVEFLQVHE